MACDWRVHPQRLNISLANPIGGAYCTVTSRLLFGSSRAALAQFEPQSADSV